MDIYYTDLIAMGQFGYLTIKKIGGKEKLDVYHFKKNKNMTYKLLKYPWMIFKLLLAIILLPIAIVVAATVCDNFREFCRGIDEWFMTWLQD